MIGKLKGIVDSTGEDWVVIDVGGVGYHVTCSRRTLSGLPATGHPVVLSIETKMSDEAIRLIGFSSDGEREWFRLLLGVQGVGTRVALGVLGALTPADLARAIALDDKKAVSAAPGVGPKVAGRIVAELKDKAPAGAGACCRCRRRRSGGCAGVRTDARRGVGTGQSRLSAGTSFRCGFIGGASA